MSRIGMRPTLEWAASRLRKESHLSDGLTRSEVLGHAVSYGTALLRGMKFRLLAPRSGGLAFCERQVQILGRRNVRFGRGLLLERGVTILARGGTVVLGERVVVGRFSVIEAASGVRHTGGKISIGADTALGDFSYIGGGGGVTIGTGCLIGQYVSFHAENHRTSNPNLPIRAQGVTRSGIAVEDDCWIGAGARILDGVTLRRGTTVGAGAVVTASTAPGAVVMGVPARSIDA
jgi:acetyltransferase-like isoleucine patch superfamily enzyme